MPDDSFITMRNHIIDEHQVKFSENVIDGDQTFFDDSYRCLICSTKVNNVEHEIDHFKHYICPTQDCRACFTIEDDLIYHELCQGCSRGSISCKDIVVDDVNVKDSDVEINLSEEPPSKKRKTSDYEVHTNTAYHFTSIA